MYLFIYFVVVCFFLGDKEIVDDVELLLDDYCSDDEADDNRKDDDDEIDDECLKVFVKII